MHFKDYQKQSRTTAIYPSMCQSYTFSLIGLVGETGEVAEKIKKLIRDRQGKLDDSYRDEIKKEMGDVLWYFSQLATDLDINLEDLVQTNLKKIKSRHVRSKIHGSGDNR
jgi:NTP pyrophosphatase (non-canonical NTP hydrolase)